MEGSFVSILICTRNYASTDLEKIHCAVNFEKLSLFTEFSEA